MIVVNALTVVAGAFHLDQVSLHVPQGGYGILMGRTGSGKTTILESICGLKSIAGGSIKLAGRDVTAMKPAQRGVGYVPQDGALFSTMTVRQHLAFSLVIRGWERKAIDRRVTELADWLGIAHLLSRKPRGLSGGESQRVALGRALACHPQVLCLDEPLSALDDATRYEMYDVLGAIRQHEGVTTLHVTHNLGEARTLADCAFVIEDGKVHSRSVDELASHPARQPDAAVATPGR